MNCRLVLVLTLAIIICVDGKRSLSGRSGSSSARGSSRRTSYNPHPAPTSLSYPQPSAPKPSLFGWQEKASPKQSKPKNTQTHSYPTSQTGLSGSGTKQAKSPSTNQESIQRSAPQNTNSQAGTGVSRTNNQASHSYPASTGLSGSPGSGYPQPSGSGTAHQPGSSYPQQTGSGISHQQGGSYPQQPGSGLSGSGAAAPPPYGVAGAPPPYSGYKPGASYPNNNYGNNYQHPAPPPPYSNYGSNYGGHPSYHSNNGAPMPGYSPQSPGFFGNYGNNGNRGMSRSGSALTGVGIAGAGVGTLLTGLALWNLARSTGNRHHTVIYDNRGQPVAVAPENSDQTEANAMLADLVNCSLTINKDDKSEVLAIPCAIATSFTPDADVKASENSNIESDNTKCIVTVVKKSGKEYMTTIPCSTLLNTAAENNVTEPPINMDDTVNATMVFPTQSPVINPNQPSPVIDPNQPLPVIDPNQPLPVIDPNQPLPVIDPNQPLPVIDPNQPLPVIDPNQPLPVIDPNQPLPVIDPNQTALIDPNQPPALSLTSGENSTGINCTFQPGEIRDPINPCYSVNHNLTVVPLPTTQSTENNDKSGQ